MVWTLTETGNLEELLPVLRMLYNTSMCLLIVAQLESVMKETKGKIRVNSSGL
jgi:hypothetical protein